MSERTCSVDGCLRSCHGRGYCKMHYLRWWKGGDAGGAETQRARQPKVCTVDGCDRGCKAKGYCTHHYERYLNGRDLTAPLHGSDGPPTYGAAHERLRYTLGSASTFRCVDCGQQAREWSYDGNGGADERRGTSSKGYPAVYSVNPDHYSPRCVPCHRAFDAKKGVA